MAKPLVWFLSFLSLAAQGREIALTFDDAPGHSTAHFETHDRTTELVRKLQVMNVPSVMIFANPCKRKDVKSVIEQLKAYTDSGHLVENHTCSHPRLDTAGFEAFSMDAEKADKLLGTLFSGQRFFRFPFLNEGTDDKARDQMRVWLKQNGYRNGLVSIDNDDTIVSDRINKAKELGKAIDYEKVKELFLRHIISATEFYDDLAVKTLGYSPKHVVLLHEQDGTVLYVDSLVRELRKRGWKIISSQEAYQDPLYSRAPRNTYAGNGIIAQIHYEKTGKKPQMTYYKWDELEMDLNALLDLPPSRMNVDLPCSRRMISDKVAE